MYDLFHFDKFWVFTTSVAAADWCLLWCVRVGYMFLCSLLQQSHKPWYKKKYCDRFRLSFGKICRLLRINLVIYPIKITLYFYISTHGHINSCKLLIFFIYIFVNFFHLLSVLRNSSGVKHMRLTLQLKSSLFTFRCMQSSVTNSLPQSVNDLGIFIVHSCFATQKIPNFISQSICSRCVFIICPYIQWEALLYLSCLAAIRPTQR